MSLEPLYDLFRHEATVKVFHAARQDLEIFFVEGNVFPKPLFDTQIAAMVCGEKPPIDPTPFRPGRYIR